MKTPKPKDIDYIIDTLHKKKYELYKGKPDSQRAWQRNPQRTRIKQIKHLKKYHKRQRQFYKYLRS
jgi:hypothetical protein